jgi:hypothetical protein
MTRYLLPDGIEAEATAFGNQPAGVPTASGHIWINHPAYGEIALKTSLLTEVKPPPPPFPDAPAMLVDGQVWRIDTWYGARQAIAPQADEPTSAARFHEMTREHSWSVVPLVPDLAHGAPELPWTYEDPYDDTIELATADERLGHKGIYWTLKVSTDDGLYITPDALRQLIAVASRALREHEASTSERAT